MRREKFENDGGEKVDENQRKPYISGAYIRSFVKQLTYSSRSMREKASVEREVEQDAKPHKKQVRRRVQTRKPYQEKLLNMAEARREIVTALKLHRAAMKQAQQKQPPQIQSSPDFTEHKFRRNFVENDVVHSPNLYSWPPPPPPAAAAAAFQENLDFVLPSQTLGLNLNLQDFITGPYSIYSSSSPSTSSSPPPPPHAAEIRSSGDEGQAEMFEFLNCGEIRGRDEREEELASSPFDEVMEFPPWLNPNESCFELVHDSCSPDYFQSPVLPCMEIEEIEGMEGDWLA